MYMKMKLYWIFVILGCLLEECIVQGSSLLRQAISTIAITCADGAEFERDTVDCTVYYQCLADGTKSLPFTCDVNLVFNQVGGYCDYASNVNDCPVSGSTYSPTNAPVEAPSPSPTSTESTTQAPSIANVPVVASTGPKPKYEKGCYYTNWAQYRNGSYSFKPENIDPSLCTTIYYAFAIMDQDYNLIPFEWNDIAAGNDKGMFQRVLDWKKTYPDLKVLLSIGGWTFNECSAANSTCTRFSDMASTYKNRKHFIETAGIRLREWGFDGIDIDWEYPARYGRNGIERQTPQDKQNLVLLAKELRQYAEAESLYSNRPRLLITLAIGVAPDVMDGGYDVPALCDDTYGFDHINMMTYDLHGAWDPVTGHNAPLYETAEDIAQQGKPGLSCAAAVEYWLERKCNPKKLVMGLGTYGRGFKLTNPAEHGFLAPVNGPSPHGVSLEEEGFFPYKEIQDMIKAGNLTEVFDEARGVPYAYNNEIWVGYDNIQSIKLKCEYIKSKGLLGGMMWTLDFDQFQSKAFPLLRTMNDVLFEVLEPEEVETETALESEIIAEFPLGLWDGKDCSAKTLRKLPTLCAAALSANATESEQLACLLITQPHETGVFPFGIYPLSLPIDTPLQDINDRMLSSPFHDCALAMMIQDGCFSFTRNTGLGKYDTETFVNMDQRLTSISHSHSGSHQFRARLFVPSAKYGWMSGESFDEKLFLKEEAAGAKRTWSNDVGILSMDTCMLGPGKPSTKYLKGDFVSKWSQFFMGSIEDLVKNSTFRELVESGLLMPTSFVFATKFTSQVDARYLTSLNSSGSSVTDGHLVDFGLTSTAKRTSDSFEMTHKWAETISSAASSSKTISWIRGKDIKYGSCRFDEMFKDLNHISDTLNSCARKASFNILQMRRMSSVAPSGFLSVVDILEAHGQSRAPLNFVDAILKLTSVCSCDSEYSYSCVNSDNLVEFRTHTYTACTKKPWPYMKQFPITLPPRHSKYDTSSSQPTIDFVKHGGLITEGFDIWSPNREYRVLFDEYGNLVCFKTSHGVVWQFSSSMGLFSGQTMRFDGRSGDLYILISDLRTVKYVLHGCGMNDKLGYYSIMIDDDGALKSISLATGTVCSTFAGTVATTP